MTRRFEDQARWLADKLATQDKKIASLQTRGELAYSSIEDGSIVEKDLEGNLVASVGKQHDGSHVAVPYTGPTPATPVAASLKAVPGVVEIRWSGKFTGNAVSAMDFKHVSVHVSTTPAVDATPSTQVATIRGELGDVATVTAGEGMLYVVLVAWSAAGKASAPSPVAAVAVQGAVDPVLLDGKLADIHMSIDGKTSIHNSLDDAVTGEYAEGDRWQKWTTLDPGGKLLASWRYTAGAWVAESMDPTYLPKIDIGAGTFGQLTGGRLVAGSVTAPLLESELVLTTDIVAGNPNGTHARLNASGFRAMASTDGQAPTEVIRLGTNTDDYFGVVNALGELVASITSGGDIAGQSGDFARDVSIAGTSLLEMLDALPKGLIAWASRSTKSAYWAGTGGAQPYLHLQFPVVAGRAYRISTTPINTDGGGTGSQARVSLHYGVQDSITTSGPIIHYALGLAMAESTPKSAITFNRLVTPTATGNAAVLISYQAFAGLCKIVADSNRPVILTVEDMGLAVAQTGEYRDGTGDASGGTQAPDPTPPPVVKNYDKTWNASGTRSFIGSGAWYQYNTSYMYSGLSPAGYGDLSSMAIFPAFYTELAGATITGAWVYVYYDFWYQGSGGNAYINFHGWASLTSTAPAKTGSFIASNGWPRAAGRWVPIPSSQWAGLKSGQHRGITLGGSGGGYERYGYAHDPKIRIKFTK